MLDIVIVWKTVLYDKLFINKCSGFIKIIGTPHIQEVPFKETDHWLFCRRPYLHHPVFKFIPRAYSLISQLCAVIIYG